jgi:hypothetical protein
MLFIIVRWVSSTLVEQPVVIKAADAINASMQQRSNRLLGLKTRIGMLLIGKRQFCMASRIIKVLILALNRRL